MRSKLIKTSFRHLVSNVDRMLKVTSGLPDARTRRGYLQG